jgi:ABC-type glucose/galactose transport system permease subunit
LSGVNAPDEGQIILEGKSHSHLSPAASQRFGVQIIYQDLSLFPNLSVAENIAFGHHVQAPVRPADPKAMRKQAEAVMERLKISLPLEALVGTLPIATRQLVAIFRALVGEQARLIVMDEPTASLTHQEVEALLAIIHELKRQGIATVFVSHRLDEVMTIAERVTIVAFLGVHPILVTLGTMTAVKGIAVYATGGGVIGGFPPAILFLGNGIFLGVPVPMILFILCAIVVAVIMSHAPFGVAVRLIGSNEKATRYSGVATDWMLMGVYVLSSLLCWVAAVVMMARFNSASADYAESYLLITILAAVLGGVDPNGGFGKVLGLFLSLVLLQIISTGFNLLGLSPHLTDAIWGATMILAIALALVRDRWMALLWLRRTSK